MDGKIDLIAGFKSKEDQWKRELTSMKNTMKKEKALSNMFRNFFTKNISANMRKDEFDRALDSAVGDLN